jgi:hypothetical protein
MNDVDDLIVEFRTEPAGSGDVAERVAEEFTRRKLREAIASESAGRDRARGRWRPPLRRRTALWLVPSVSAVALAVGVLVIASVLPSRDSSGDNVILPPLAPTSASAAVVLNRVATVAARQPPSLFASRGQLAYSKVLSGSTTSISYSESPRSKRCGASIVFSYSFTEQDWVAPDGSGRQLIVRGLNTVQPRFQAIAGRFRKYMNGTEPSMDSRYRPTMFPYSSPAGLPTDPRRLLAAIVRRFEHGKYDLATTFQRAEELIVASASPALRAALYRMLAQLPGVQFLGHHRDQIGRAGITVGMTDSAGIRIEILFDPATSQLLAESDIQAAVPPHLPRCVPVLPVGTVLDYSDYLRTGIVNSITDLPGGGRIPYHPTPAPAGGAPGAG